MAVWRDELESSDGELGVGGLKDTGGGGGWSAVDSRGCRLQDQRTYRRCEGSKVLRISENTLQPEFKVSCSKITRDRRPGRSQAVHMHAEKAVAESYHYWWLASIDCIEYFLQLHANTESKGISDIQSYVCSLFA